MNETAERLRQLKAIAFDLDDTLVESGYRLLWYHKQVLGRLALASVPSDETISDLVGGPTSHVFKSLYPEDRAEEAQRIFREFAVRDTEPARMIEGVPRALGRLAAVEGLQQIVATNRRSNVERAMECGGLAVNSFPLIYTGNDGAKSRSLLKAIEELGIQPHELAMVGDTRSDMVAAADADPDILKVGVLDFASSREELMQASNLTYMRVPHFTDEVVEAFGLTA